MRAGCSRSRYGGPVRAEEGTVQASKEGGATFLLCRLLSSSSFIRNSVALGSPPVSEFHPSSFRSSRLPTIVSNLFLILGK